MEYKGKLYGKVGTTYFPMVNNTEDWEALTKENEELKEALNIVKTSCDLYYEAGQNLGEENTQLKARVKELEDGFTIFENAYICKRELNEEEAKIIDELRLTINR